MKSLSVRLDMMNRCFSIAKIHNLKDLDFKKYFFAGKKLNFEQNNTHIEKIGVISWSHAKRRLLYRAKNRSAVNKGLSDSDIHEQSCASTYFVPIQIIISSKLNAVSRVVNNSEALPSLLHFRSQTACCSYLEPLCIYIQFIAVYAMPLHQVCYDIYLTYTYLWLTNNVISCCFAQYVNKTPSVSSERVHQEAHVSSSLIASSPVHL